MQPLQEEPRSTFTSSLQWVKFKLWETIDTHVCVKVLSCAPKAIMWLFNWNISKRQKPTPLFLRRTNLTDIFNWRPRSYSCVTLPSGAVGALRVVFLRGGISGCVVHSLLTQLNKTQWLMSYKQTTQKEKAWERRLHTRDKCPDRPHAWSPNTYAHSSVWKGTFFKRREIHQGFSAFEKPFNDSSRDID